MSQAVINNYKKQYNELLKRQIKYTNKIENMSKNLEGDELIKALQLEQDFYLEIQDTKHEIEYILKDLKDMKVKVSNIEILKGFDLGGDNIE